MAELKILGKTLKEWGDTLDAHELSQERMRAEKAADREARKDKIDAYLGRGTPTGNIDSRTDFSDEKIGPKYKSPKKITREKTTVEGDIGSVDRDNPDVIGPNMGQVLTAAAQQAEPEMDLQEKARKSMGFKRGGKVKKACGGGRMKSGGKVSSASKRADGIATKGKTKGRFV